MWGVAVGSCQLDQIYPLSQGLVGGLIQTASIGPRSQQQLVRLNL